MTRPSNYRVLVIGILSPLAALFLYALVYSTLTRASGDLEKDWLFRLSLSTLAMTLPFLVTLALAIKNHRRHALSLSGRIGFAIAILSLGLAWNPVSDGITRWKQSRNMAMRDVAAPPFHRAPLRRIEAIELGRRHSSKRRAPQARNRTCPVSAFIRR